jgi:hypothetical protein
MNNRSTLLHDKRSALNDIAGWIFGIAVFAAGLVNTFWGNDPGFGIFLCLLAFAYFPPVNVMIRERVGFAFPLIVKILLAVFIIMATLGVGELFDKIYLMLVDLNLAS